MADEVFVHKQVFPNGDIMEIRVFRFPPTNRNPDGVHYSAAYIRDGRRVIGYDNNEGHGKNLFHHKHINDRVIPYHFIDEWKLIEDFMEDIEKIRRSIAT